MKKKILTGLISFAMIMGMLSSIHVTVNAYTPNTSYPLLTKQLTPAYTPSLINSYIVSLSNGNVVSCADIVTNPGSTGDNLALAATHAPVTLNADTELSKNEQFEVLYSDTSTSNYKGTFLIRSMGRSTTPSNFKLLADDGKIDPRTGKNSSCTVGGWESFVFVPQGDGTVAILAPYNSKKYVSLQSDNTLKATVGNNITVSNYATTPITLTDKEKFIIVTPTVSVAPTSLSAIDKSDINATLTWQRPTAAANASVNAFFTGFNVYRSEDNGLNWTKCNSSPVVSMDPVTQNSSDVINQLYTFKDTFATGGHTYQYKVTAVNWAGESAASTPITVTTAAGPVPPIPTGLDITDTSGTLNVTWPTVTDARSYDVYRAASRYGTYTKLTTTPITETSYSDNTYSAAGIPAYSVYYKIAANNVSGASKLSDPISKEMKLFGPNVYIFNNLNGNGKGDPDTEINKVGNGIFSQQESAQFGDGRYALLFKRSIQTYGTNFNEGFYTHIAGLGLVPTDVKTAQLTVNAAWLGNHNATCNFWRSIENLEITNTGTTMWAVSQAAPMRRLQIDGKLTLDDTGGWASGGFLADSVIKGQAGSGAQQQWISRNDNFTYTGGPSWSGVNWNAVFVGCQASNGISTNSGNPCNYTNVTSTPVIKEKPFLFYDTTDNNYKVFVPSLRTNAMDTSWTSTNPGSGTIISIDNFYVAKPGDSAATINAQLESGKNLLLTPGIYHVSEPIMVNNPNTVVLGLGLATIVPDNSVIAMKVADVDGVSIAGIIFDAGLGDSPKLMEVGTPGSSTSHSSNPTLLSDLFFRIGGGNVGPAMAETSMEVNSKDVIGDHFWLWRADHGTQVGWNLNKAQNGLIVNGGNFTMYGLFCEHYQGYETLWNGNGGRLYFFQNELPYDVPYQSNWMAPDGKNGFAAYKVAESVTSHEAWGLGVYDVFINNIGYIKLSNAIEVPNSPDVSMHNMCTLNLGSGVGGEITNIINGKGQLVGQGVQPMRQYVGEYCNNLPDPLISPAFGSYISDQTITITDADTKASIRYTLDGTIPTATTGTLYTGSFTLSPSAHQSYTVTAVAFDGASISQPISTNYVFSIAYNKPAIASTEYTNNGTLNKAAYAFDADNASTRWESNQTTNRQDNQWIQVDLQNIYSLDFTRLIWQSTASCGYNYKLQYSIDGSSWSDLYQLTNNTATINTYTCTSLKPQARYVRMLGTEKNGTYGYSLYGFEVYGSPAFPASPTSAVYDASAGTLTIHGNYLVGSADVSKMSLKGLDGAVATLTSVSSLNPVIDASGNSITVTLGATDKAAVEGLKGFKVNYTLPGGLNLATDYLGAGLGSAATVDVTVINAAVSVTLNNIIAPTAITGLSNGTAKTAEALGLPSTVMLVTNLGNVTANVAWDVDASNYDSTLKTAQTFKVNGIVTLPTGVVNINNVPLTTSVLVTVVALPYISLDPNVLKINATNYSGKMYFLSTAVMQEGYKLVKCGVVISKDITNGLDLDNNLANLEAPQQSSKGQFYSVFNVTYNHTIYVRSYLVFEDANGTRTVYSDIATVTMTKQ